MKPKIPKGWRRVTRGKARKGDKWWCFDPPVNKWRWDMLPEILQGIWWRHFHCLVRKERAR